jgi:predicted permease
MSWRHVVSRRLRALFRRHAVEREMEEELALHYELAVEERIRAGEAPRVARANALQEFRGADGAREMYREARGTGWVERVAQDARYAVRTLVATPAFTIVIVATLALGIGANSAVFSVVHAVLLRELPYEAPDRLVMVWETDRDSGTEREGASIPDYFDFRARARSFASLAAFRPVPMNRSGDAAPERVWSARVTREFLATLGVTPVLGRDFVEAEAAPGGPPAVLVSTRYWRTRLGADPAVLGGTLRLDDSLFTIVGVLPERFHFPDDEVELWAIDQMTPASGERYRHHISVVGRLASTASIRSAQREMDAVARALEEEYPQSNTSRGVYVEPLEQVLLGDVRPGLLLLLGAVGVVLLISCVNAANLLLARRAARSREIAVRAALGAGRGRLVQQLVVESGIIALAAAAVGLLLAQLGVRALVAIAPPSLPRAEEIAVDGTVLMVTLGVSVAVALVFGLLPAAGGQQATPAQTLSSAGSRTGTGSREHTRLRSLLVVAEIAMAVLLVAGAGLLLRSFWTIRAVNPGFEPENTLAVRYQLPPSRYPQDFSNYPAGWERTFAFQRDVLERVRAVPGVRRAALAFNDPLTPGFTNSFLIEGREAEAAQGQAEVPTRPVSAGYFATAGVPLLAGRDFAESDAVGAPPVLIINQAMMDRYFPDTDPLGHRIRFWGATREIIGVVGNERFDGLAADAAPAMYPPIAQAPATLGTLLVRTAGDPNALLPAVRQAIWSIDRDLAPFDVRTMEEAIDASLAQQRFLALLLAAFGGVALVLALVGVYGVIAYSVAQRGREIGIRLALGATSLRVWRAVVGEGARMAAAGGAIGIALALGTGRLVRSQLHGVSAADPLTLAAAAGLLVAIAILGSAIPAWRASALAPGEVLRGS